MQRIWLGAVLLIALARAGSAEPEVRPAVPLGRANPFLPLVGAPPPPKLPDVPSVATAAASPRAPAPSFRFVGIVYDRSEAIAAVRMGDRTQLLHVGQSVEGARIVAIGPRSLTLTREGRTLRLPLSTQAGGTP